MSADLVRFVEARIAEDEAAGTWGQGCITVADPAPRISIDPARVLRQCEAFRRMLERHKDCGLGYGYCDDGGHGIWRPEDGGPGCADLQDLASIWADHPDYRQEWAA